MNRLGFLLLTLTLLVKADPPGASLSQKVTVPDNMRTGVFSAILLTALGVPRRAVVQDYLLSNQFLLAPDAIQSTAADLQLAFGFPELPDLSTVKTIMTARPETLEGALDKIDETYGSFANYLRDAVKLPDSDLARIRQRLLEP